LEVLRITEAEMDLRDRTREVETARPLLPREAYGERSKLLEVAQTDLVGRTDGVIDAISELPEGETDFGKELATLEEARGAMVDAERLLRKPATMGPTVAAETAAIEALLRARRGGGGGGGGGGSPGGGGATEAVAEASALALAGRAEEVGAEVAPRGSNAATARPTQEVPEELRASLDRYFEKLGGRP